MKQNTACKRIFLIVLDSLGIGAMPDAADYGDEGSNTLLAISHSKNFCVPNLSRLGLLNIDGIANNASFAENTACLDGDTLSSQNFSISNTAGAPTLAPTASCARLAEKSAGKDTTIGHWELAGIVSKKPLPVFPNGFPTEFIKAFEDAIGRKTLCNLPFSGTEVIKKYGKQHQETGYPIVYTSADSVFQIAAHEDIIPISELYNFCEIAREMLQGDLGVGRVIARPFEGEYPFKRTEKRKDFSLPLPAETMLDKLKKSGFDVISVGKIWDIFGGQGITKVYTSKTNDQGMDTVEMLAKMDFDGLVFANLVDFDMLYGHRNDIDGYAAALSQFDKRLGDLLPQLKESDVLIITADHGCDPSTPSTDHSREYVPLLIYGDAFSPARNLGTINGFDFVSQTVLDLLS